jgi:hypothetical protein
MENFARIPNLIGRKERLIEENSALVELLVFVFRNRYY